jgi:hypothetical protein
MYICAHGPKRVYDRRTFVFLFGFRQVDPTAGLHTPGFSVRVCTIVIYGIGGLYRVRSICFYIEYCIWCSGADFASWTEGREGKGWGSLVLHIGYCVCTVDVYPDVFICCNLSYFHAVKKPCIPSILTTVAHFNARSHMDLNHKQRIGRKALKHIYYY